MTALKGFLLCMLSAGLFTSGCASINTLVVLFPEDRSTASAVSIGEGNRMLVLDKPYSAATVDRQGNVAAKVLTPEEANRTFADAFAAQPPPPVSFMLHFETNSVEVTTASRATLDALLAEVAKRSAVEVQVTGHTDRVGNPIDNDRLSLQRAEAVGAMLIKRGIQATFLRAVGRGEREPLIATPDEQPEPRNRRVEVIVR
jgi:OmpA-OmpF porin, OOP family